MRGWRPRTGAKPTPSNQCLHVLTGYTTDRLTCMRRIRRRPECLRHCIEPPGRRTRQLGLAGLGLALAWLWLGLACLWLWLGLAWLVLARLSLFRPSARPSARPPVPPSARPSVRPSARPPVRLSVCPPVRPSARPSVRPPTDRRQSGGGQESIPEVGKNPFPR
jgi:hypothetical protein